MICISIYMYIQNIPYVYTSPFVPLSPYAQCRKLPSHVGYSTSTGDRLEHAAGLADGWHAHGLLPLGAGPRVGMFRSCMLELNST